MNNPSALTFVETKEYRRFVEFCDACRRYQYIGLCYGPPGVGKTLSARHYANWAKSEAYDFVFPNSAVQLEDVVGSSVVLYTAKVVNSAGQIERDISQLRRRLQRFLLQKIHRDQEAPLEEARKREKEARQEFAINANWLIEKYREPEPTVAQITRKCAQSCREAVDPTTLLIIDEADRFKMAGLDLVRDIFDQGSIGLVLIGMPGIEKRLSRYPQLYSRVGFVHEFRPLAAAEIRRLFHERWSPPGVVLPENGIVDQQGIASILRVTGGNFRLLHRLLTQVGRILEINKLQVVTHQVIEAARESLVIGTA